MIEVEALNRRTGELISLAAKNIDDLKEMYNQYEQEKKDIEAKMEAIKKRLGKVIPEDAPYEFADGSVGRWMSLPRYEYPKEVVSEYLDPDQMDVVTKIDGTKLKSVVKEMVENKELQSGAWEHIMNHADVKYSKPFVKIERKK